VKLKRILLDDRARPHALHEVELAHELAARLHENLNNLERAAS
jgi:hypothetical protein